MRSWVLGVGEVGTVPRQIFADSRSSNEPSPIREGHELRHKCGLWRANQRGSSLRHPPGQRAPGLYTVDFCSQQLVAHAQIGNEGFQPLSLFVLDIGLTSSQ